MRSSAGTPVRRILRQYISITHKKKNKSFEVAERPDYSRGGNNKEDPANEPGTATFKKKTCGEARRLLRVIKFYKYYYFQVLWASA